MRVALAIALAASASAGLAAEPFDPEREKWGTVEALIAPDYPREALRRGQTGSVVIRGTVSPHRGRLENIQYVPDRPESKVFVEAIEDLVPRWKFNPPVKDCMPSDEIVTAEMSFEIDEGKPRIFLTRGAKPKGGSTGPSDPNYRILKRVNPGWPKDMLALGWTATVYSRIEIDNAGKVVGVTSRTYSPRVAYEESLDSFTKMAARTYKRWQFVPVADDFAPHRSACYELQFVLTN